MSVLTFHFVVSFIWRGIVLFFGFMVTLGRSGLTWNSVGMADGHYNPNLVSFKRKEAALETPPLCSKNFMVLSWLQTTFFAYLSVGQKRIKKNNRTTWLLHLDDIINPLMIRRHKSVAKWWQESDIFSVAILNLDKLHSWHLPPLQWNPHLFNVRWIVPCGYK